MASPGNTAQATDPPGASAALVRLLGAGLFSVAVAGLAAEIAYFHFELPGELAAFFSLSAEANLPTWYASVLLFSCGILLAAIARREAAARDRFHRHWAVLAAVFVYMSLDEAVEIHEHLGGIVEAGGVLYFSWVVPAAVIVVVVGVAYLPFLAHLDPRTRRRFVVAGGLYVGGALLMELPLGWWTEQHGSDNLGYALIDFVEETMELAGASWFLVGLWKHHSGS